MNKVGFKIRIINDKFGELLNEMFMDETQFKIFLKMVHGCLELGNDLRFFNGDTFLINIPFRFLKDSIIVTGTEEFDIVDQVKSKIEALVTK
jgi:hypothetical protein